MMKMKEISIEYPFQDNSIKEVSNEGSLQFIMKFKLPFNKQQPPSIKEAPKENLVRLHIQQNILFNQSKMQQMIQLI